MSKPYSVIKINIKQGPFGCDVKGFSYHNVAHSILSVNTAVKMPDAFTLS